MTNPDELTAAPTKPLAAGVFQPEIGSFRLCLAAEGKSGKTVRMYTEAVQWFAAAHLIPATSWTRWEQVSGRDIQRWMVWLLGRYSDSYASNQYRALQQFFKWWAGEEGLPDPMARLRPPRVTEKFIPVFTSGELSKLEKACAGRSFAQRRDLAVIAVFRATGVRLSELAGIVYDPEDAQRSDVDLWQREITVRGKGGKARIVRISHQTAVTLDRYIRVRARHAQAYRPQLWLGVNNRGPVDSERHLPDDCPPWPPERGGRSSAPVPSSLQPHLVPGRRRGRPDGTERVDLPADAAPLRRQRPRRTSPPQLRPHHGPHHLKPETALPQLLLRSPGGRGTPPCGTSRAVVPAATRADSDAGSRRGTDGLTVPGGAVIKTGQTRADTRSHDPMRAGPPSLLSPVAGRSG